MTTRNGLRDENGALIGGLDVLAYSQGHKDWADKAPPPAITSPSYDLGRQRAADDAEMAADVMRGINERAAASSREVRKMLAHRPDLLAKYDAKMEAIKNG